MAKTEAVDKGVVVGESLLTKYRPNTLDEVVGQDAVCDALWASLGRGKAFAFVGPSGVGKTTLARLAARELGCGNDIQEVDAATYTGIDDMRGLMSALQYRPLGGGKKAVIVDEAHGLSKQAFDSLLKMLEEPPSWVYWFLCTTNPAKLPKAVVTRCLLFELKPVSSRVLEDYLADIAKAERLTVPDDVVDLCAREARGSPRQALSNLAVCSVAKSRAEAADLLHAADETGEVIELARALLQGARWREVQEILIKLKDTSPESIRQVVRAYFTKVVLGAKTDDDAGRALEVLDAFSEPLNTYDGMSPIVLACGKLLLGRR